MSKQLVKKIISKLNIKLLIEISIIICIVIFNNWNYDFRFGNIPGDLPSHYNVVTEFLSTFKIVPYRRYFYPPISHILTSIIITILNLGKDFSLEYFYHQSYNVWFVLLGINSWLVMKLVQKLVRPFWISIFCALLIGFSTDTVTLLKWYGFAQFLGVFVILILTYYLFKLFDIKKVSKSNIVILTLLQLLLFLTHQYSSILWIGGIIIFVCLLAALNLKDKNTFQLQLVKVLSTTGLAAGVLSLILYNHKFLERPGEVEKGRSVVDIFKNQIEGGDKRYKKYTVTLESFLVHLRRLINTYSLYFFYAPSLSVITSKLNSFKTDLKTTFISVFFLLPFLIPFLDLTGYPMHFYTRMPHFWHPFAVLLLGIFINKVQNSLGKRSAQMYSLILLIFYLSLAFPKKIG